MTRIECPYEQDLVDAIRTGRWPARPGSTDLALAQHVAGCGVCRDVAAVALAVMEAEAEPDALSNVTIPDASAVWLRAQWRARAEAARRATHPITAAQAASIAGLAALGGALFGATSGWFQRGLGGAVDSLARSIPDRAAVSDTVMALVSSHLAASITVGVFVILVPALALWATRDA